MSDRVIRIFSRDKQYRSVIVMQQDSYGFNKEITKFISGMKYIDWPEDLLGWDVANKIKAGLLKVQLSPSQSKIEEAYIEGDSNPLV